METLRAPYCTVSTSTNYFSFFEKKSTLTLDEILVVGNSYEIERCNLEDDQMICNKLESHGLELDGLDYKEYPELIAVPDDYCTLSGNYPELA